MGETAEVDPDGIAANSRQVEAPLCLTGGPLRSLRDRSNHTCATGGIAPLNPRLLAAIPSGSKFFFSSLMRGGNSAAWIRCRFNTDSERNGVVSISPEIAHEHSGLQSCLQYSCPPGTSPFRQSCWRSFDGNAVPFAVAGGSQSSSGCGIRFGEDHRSSALTTGFGQCLGRPPRTDSGSDQPQ